MPDARQLLIALLELECQPAALQWHPRHRAASSAAGTRLPQLQLLGSERLDVQEIKMWESVCRSIVILERCGLSCAQGQPLGWQGDVM